MWPIPLKVDLYFFYV
jgi:dynein heavy chain, axonemal